MSLEDDIQMMGRTPPLNLLPREALQLLAFSCTKKALKAGETLFVEGEPADAAYFVLSGAIALASRGVKRRVESGSLIGETALLTDVSRRASARAAEDCIALRIPSEVFRRVLSEFPQAAAKIHAAASARTRELLEKLEKVRSRSFNA
ncbi:MAG: Crp/Fnr family transcriptional regulator [Roseiarcus sp.]|jgi:CRP-like cAMP-binding protein